MTKHESRNPVVSTLPAATDPGWRLQLGILAILAALTTLVFWNSDLDLQVAGNFYHPDAPNGPWPGEFQALWQFFYFGAPIFTALLAVGALLIMLLGLTRNRFHAWRRPAALFLLTLVLGPGLLVNLLFKENWGRPRPRQVEQFAGDRQYIPPLRMGETKDGKSFVAGHASVGFSLFAFWFLWRRRRPQLAWTFLGAATLMGLTMGLGRMAAGAHFLSDVLWSGYVTFFSAGLLHYFVLREQPPRAISTDARSSPLALTGYAVLGSALLMGSLVSLPVNRDIDFQPGPKQLPLLPDLILNLDQALVDIHLLPPGENQPLHIAGRIRGFGLPTYDIESLGQKINRPQPGYHYRLRQKGFFIELDTRLTVSLSESLVQRLRVNLQQGDIRVISEPGAVAPKLELHTDKGRVLLPAR